MTEAVAPKTVGVIGGGRMGAGIAQVFASLGGAVTIAESGDTAAALQRVSAGLDRAHERGKLDDQDPATVLARVSTVDAVTSLPPSLDLIVEAVQEIAALKVEVLAAAETVAGESTVIASNTSSMSIAELGAALSDPGRFIGMHFFNPVPASLLVEIVRAPQTRPEVVDSVRAWVSMLGKAEVLVNDSPGFATSRLGVRSRARSHPHARRGCGGRGIDRPSNGIGISASDGPAAFDRSGRVGCAPGDRRTPREHAR